MYTKYRHVCTPLIFFCSMISLKIKLINSVVWFSLLKHRSILPHINVHCSHMGVGGASNKPEHIIQAAKAYTKFTLLEKNQNSPYKHCNQSMLCVYAGRVFFVKH